MFDHSTRRAPQAPEVLENRSNSPSMRMPLTCSSTCGSAQAASTYSTMPTSTRAMALRASVRRHRQSKPSISSHCSAPVRELVAAAATASTASAPPSTMPMPHWGRCTRSARTHSQSRDHTPSAISDACWLRWRRLPTASPGVDGWIHGKPQGSAPRYCNSPTTPPRTAASSSPHASAPAARLPRRTHWARVTTAAPCTSPQAASTRPQAQENTSGQKLGDGGAVTANRKGSATASTASSVLRAENGIVWGLRKGQKSKDK